MPKHTFNDALKMIHDANMVYVSIGSDVNMKKADREARISTQQYPRFVRNVSDAHVKFIIYCRQLFLITTLEYYIM